MSEKKQRQHTFTISIQLEKPGNVQDVREHIASSVRVFGERYKRKHPLFPKNIQAIVIKEVEDNA